MSFASLVGSDSLGGGRLAGPDWVFFEGHRSSSSELDVVFCGTVVILQGRGKKLISPNFPLQKQYLSLSNFNTTLE